MAVQGVLNRKVNGELKDVYLKTSADLVTLDDGSTVLDKMSYCLEQITELNKTSGNVDEKIQTSVDSLYKEIAGVDSASDLSGDAFNNIKKISDALHTNTTSISELKTNFDNISKDLTSYIKASDLATVATTGKYSDLIGAPDVKEYTVATTAKDGLMSSDDKSKLDNIQASATKVEASDTNGNIKINGVETTVYTASAISKDDIGLDKVGNYKAVSVDAQTLTEKEQQQARTNIGITTVFSGSYDDLTDKPVNATTKSSGLMSSDDKSKLDDIQSSATKVEKSDTNGNIKINGVETTVYTASEISKTDIGLDKVGNYKAVSTEASQSLSLTEQQNARDNIGAAAATAIFSGDYEDLTNKPDVATTTKNGLMSYEDKAKLDDLNADSGKTTVTKSTTNGNILVDGEEVKVYTAPELATVATSGSYTDLSDKPTIPTYEVATASKAGLMSGPDKDKLDSLDLNNLSKTTVTASTTNGNILVDGKEVTVYTAEDIPEATTETAGLMSAADKTKLDGLSNNTGGITEGTVGTLTALTFTSSTNYSITNGYYRCSDGICVVTGIVTCNKLVIPQADVTLNSSMPKAAIQQIVNIMPTGEGSYPPIKITMTTDGKLNMQGGASGCTYYVQFMYIATV